MPGSILGEQDSSSNAMTFKDVIHSSVRKKPRAVSRKQSLSNYAVELSKALLEKENQIQSANGKRNAWKNLGINEPNPGPYFNRSSAQQYAEGF